MKKLILIVLFVLLPLAALVRFWPEPEPVEIPAPQIAKKARKAPQVVLKTKKDKRKMATYQMTGAAVGAANQNYTGASTPFTGVTDGSYVLNLEESGTVSRLRLGSQILYFNDTLVGIYENDPVDNAGDVSTPEVTDVSAPSGSGSGGLMLKYKQQQ